MWAIWALRAHKHNKSARIWFSLYILILFDFISSHEIGSIHQSELQKDISIRAVMCERRLFKKD